MKSSKISSDHQITLPLTLNDLPENVIDHILTFLPIRTAISASLISRSWRHHWKLIPDLVFHNLPDIFISQLLLLHRGPIRKFGVIAPKASHSVDCWLVSLSYHAIHHLHSLTLNFTLQSAVPYHLHSAAFSLHHLTEISLSKCTLALPRDFSGFKYLSVLKLALVDFPDGGQLSFLLSTSPLLTTVSLFHVKGRGCLKICAPNIRLLILRVEFDDIALGSAPFLETASVALNVDGGDGGFHSNDVDDYDMRQWLALGPHSSKVSGAYSTPSFDHISLLYLTINFATIGSISASILLLRSCPNLKELVIQRYICNEFAAGAVQDIWDAERHFDLFSNLRTVRVNDFLFQDPELEILRIILQKAKVLETMVITFNNTAVTNKESAMMKLLGFRRASNQAQIICKT